MENVRLTKKQKGDKFVYTVVDENNKLPLMVAFAESVGVNNQINLKVNS
jgi:hypothetical protein